jgi:hypothetical protein
MALRPRLLRRRGGRRHFIDVLSEKHRQNHGASLVLRQYLPHSCSDAIFLADFVRILRILRPTRLFGFTFAAKPLWNP